MSEIQEVLVSKTLEYINSLIAKAVVTIDGVPYEKEIYKTRRQGDTIRKYVYLDVEKGLVSRASLVDTQGIELYVKELEYTKGSDGFLICFPIQLKQGVIM